MHLLIIVKNDRVLQNKSWNLKREKCSYLLTPSQFMWTIDICVDVNQFIKVKVGILMINCF